MKRFVSLCLAALLAVSLFAVPSSALTLEEVRTAHPARLPDAAPVLSVGEKKAFLAGLYEASLSEIRDAIVLGLVSSQEVTEYYLERIAAYNEEYNCFITLLDNASEQAARRDAELPDTPAPGPLYGVPVVVKDNIHVEGYLTTNGLSKSSSKISTENADVVEYLLNAGAVIIGKTNMSTEAQDARASRSAAVGETKNAYSTYLASGGSSGGSAVAVSLNFAAAGLGTDTNSSLRVPAALAGCVAMRVTTGLLSRDGVILLNTARDVPGAITRSVADQALMLDVLSGGEYGFYENLNADALSGARIGILKQLSYAYSTSGERRQENLDEEVQAAFAGAVEELRACGAEVVEVSMPSLFSLSEATFPVGGYQKIPDFTAAFEEFLEKNELDCVIFPTYLSTPLRSGRDENGTYWNVYDQIFINNCRVLSPSAAVPEITIPIGNHTLGAGIGMQIAGKQHNEQLLLNIAYSYTERYDHRTVPVGAAELRADAGTLEELTTAYLRSLLLPEKTLEERSVESLRTAAAAVKLGRELSWEPPMSLLPVFGAVLAVGVAAVAVLLLLNRPRKRRRYRGRREIRR